MRFPSLALLLVSATGLAGCIVEGPPRRPPPVVEYERRPPPPPVEYDRRLPPRDYEGPGPRPY